MTGEVFLAEAKLELCEGRDHCSLEQSCCPSHDKRVRNEVIYRLVISHFVHKQTHTPTAQDMLTISKMMKRITLRDNEEQR